MNPIGIREIRFYELKQRLLHCLYIPKCHKVFRQRLLVKHLPHIEHLLIILFDSLAKYLVMSRVVAEDIAQAAVMQHAKLVQHLLGELKFGLTVRPSGFVATLPHELPKVANGVGYWVYHKFRAVVFGTHGVISTKRSPCHKAQVMLTDIGIDLLHGGFRVVVHLYAVPLVFGVSLPHLFHMQVVWAACEAVDPKYGSSIFHCLLKNRFVVVFSGLVSFVRTISPTLTILSLLRLRL